METTITTTVISSRPLGPLFRPGRIVATPGALAAIEARYPGTSRDASNALIKRHLFGDWSDMEPGDQRANREAVRDGERVFSMYYMAALEGEEKGARIWIITEWDRSYTTLLLPHEY